MSLRGIASGLGMKARGEEWYEFRPNYTPNWGEHEALLKPPAAYGLEGFESFELHLGSHESVTAWYKPPKEGYATVAYCHSNAGSLDMRRHQLKALADLGLGVMIATYPGFKGEFPHARILPSEKSCIETGHAMVRELVMQKDVDPEKIVLFGESLGGAVALRTAYDLEQPDNFLDDKPVQVGTVITLNTFESLVKRAYDSFPEVPFNEMMQNRFESDAIISKINAPILLMHGENDAFTSFEHSKSLWRDSGEKAEFVLIPGCNHSLTKPNTEDEFDHGQLASVINCAQQFLFEHGLYPTPAPVAVKELVTANRVNTPAG